MAAVIWLTSPRYKAPFIFANFNGTAHDVDTLTHEVGHAFQGYESRNIKVSEYRQPTLEACEIHSMSMEFFAWPWMESFFDNAKNIVFPTSKEQLNSFLMASQLMNSKKAFIQIPDMTHAERCALWRKIEKKYLPIRNYKGTST